MAAAQTPLKALKIKDLQLIVMIVLIGSHVDLQSFSSNLEINQISRGKAHTKYV